MIQDSLSFGGVKHWMNLMQLDENKGKILGEFQKSWTMDAKIQKTGPKPMQHIYLSTMSLKLHPIISRN
jgi:hypothetical protein